MSHIVAQNKAGFYVISGVSWVGLSMMREFDVTLEPEADGSYSVHVPSLPGCHSAGETRKQALDSIKEAIELYLESLADHNEPLPDAARYEHERVSVAA